MDEGVVTSNYCLLRAWREWALKEVFTLPGEVRSYFWANWPAIIPFEVSLAGHLWQMEGRHAAGHE